MNFKARLTRKSTLQHVGWSFLILAGAANFLARRNPDTWPGLLDPAMGFLYGVAIACLLLSLRSDTRGSAPRNE